MSEEPGTNEPTSSPSESPSPGGRELLPYKEFVPTKRLMPSRPVLSHAKRMPILATLLIMTITAVGVIYPMYKRQKPDHCPNDASRWSTVFYLVEYGTYEYLPDWWASWTDGKGKLEGIMTEEDKAQRPFQIGEKWYRMPWDIMPFWTIDFVSFEKEDGTRQYYSSKPPLFPTCVAGVVMALEKISHWEFWPLYHVPPMNFAKQAYPWHLMRITLIIVQVVPFLLLIFLMAKIVSKQSDSTFVRLFCIASTALATFLTPYLTTLNNHVVAACMVMFAAYAFLRIWYDGRRGAIWFLAAGFCGASGAALELPAASVLAAILVLLLFKNARKTLMVALPAALLVIGAALLTNWMGTGQRMIEPVYSHFGEQGGPYDFPGSYWMANEYNPNGPSGMDALNELKPLYLFNLLLGHHGFFLLTPIMFIALLGIVRHWVREDDRGQPMFACLVLMISMVVVGFYTFRTNNYGGGAQGPRWLFWLIPLWLLMLPSGVELLKRSWIGKGVCFLLLLVSLYTVVGAMPRSDDEIRPWSTISWAHECQRSDRAPDWLRIKY